MTFTPHHSPTHKRRARRHTHTHTLRVNAIRTSRQSVNAAADSERSIGAQNGRSHRRFFHLASFLARARERNPINSAAPLSSQLVVWVKGRGEEGGKSGKSFAERSGEKQCALWKSHAASPSRKCAKARESRAPFYAPFIIIRRNKTTPYFVFDMKLKLWLARCRVPE